MPSALSGVAALCYNHPPRGRVGSSCRRCDRPRRTLRSLPSTTRSSRTCRLLPNATSSRTPPRAFSSFASSGSFSRSASPRPLGSTSPEENQVGVLRQLKARDLLPREVADLFHGLRQGGNAAAHFAQGDHRETLHLLKMAGRLPAWGELMTVGLRTMNQVLDEARQEGIGERCRADRGPQPSRTAAAVLPRLA